MKTLKDNAVRAREILKREQSPISGECESVVRADLERVLSGYFTLAGKVNIQVERGELFTIKIEAKASEIKPFGVIRF